MGVGSKYAGIEKQTGKDGRVRWVARASKRVAGGRLHFEQIHNTEREANAARREWLAAHEGGKIAPHSRATVADALTTWLDTHAALKAPATQRAYQDTVRTQLLPSRLAQVPLAKLDTGTIQGWYNSLTHLSNHNRRQIHLRLCQALDMAALHKHLRENPARACTVPPQETKPGIALTDDQVRAFLAVADGDHYWPFWHIALATAMRRGELLGLRWSDVDFKAGTLTVRQTRVHVRKPVNQPRGKTPWALRPVQVGPGVLALLRKQQGRQEVWRGQAGDHWVDTGAVFCTRWGNYVDPSHLLEHKTYLLEAAGLPKAATIHTLRHTSISHQLNSGVPIAAVAQRSGYKNAKIMLAVYTHHDQRGQLLAASVGEQLISGGELAGDDDGSE